MTNRPTALGDLRVLDLAGPIGWYCTKLLADLGADVLRIEPPGGDPARKLAPFAHDDPSKSLPYWHFNTSKRAREIDLTTDAGKAELQALALEADILVESTTPGSGALGFAYEEIAADNPRLIWTAITPFGQTGPRATWRGHDITGIAMGGLMNLAGVPASPPSQGAGDLGFQQASVIGAVGTMVALHERDKSGQGQLVDVSMQETVAAAIENTLPYLDLMGIPRKRLGYKSFGGQTAVFECKDGWLVGWLGRRWDAFTQWLDEVHMLPDEWRDPKWKDEVYRFQHLDDIDEVMSKLTMNLNKEDIYVASQQHRIANAPVAIIDELFTKDPQLTGREFWVDVEQQDGTVARMPGAPYRFTETPWRISRPAPLPGEHNGQGWITPRAEPRPPRPTSREAGPLAGLRVIDFTWQIAGPLTSQVFADHGADVLKIESNVHPDGLRNMPVPRPPGTDSMNQSGIFNLFNSSKRSITLDLRTPEGLDLLRQLISIADVTLDNYGVDPFPRWGLTPEKLWELNPELIIARSSVMGRSGPRKDFIGFGYSISAAAGLNSHTGFPGDPPVGMVIAQPDYSSNPYHLATAILAAIHYRERTGRGQLIDLSQHESTVIFNGPALLDYSVNGRVAKPRMNRNPNFAPHGAYPARGEDRWVALMCENDTDWRTLAEVIGRPELADDPRFATLAARKAHEDELDAVVAAWTRLWSPHEVMEILQNAGLAAGAVQNSIDLNRDPHLRFRQQLVRVPHAELGRMTLPRRGFVLSRTPGRFRRPPVLLGEDTDDILRDLLALDEDKLAMAYVEGVIM